MNYMENLKADRSKFRWLPERYRQAIDEIETLKPGLESENMKAALELLPGLYDGGMVVLAGPIGCGKTFAACVLGALTSFHQGDFEETEYHNGQESKVIRTLWVRLEGKFLQARSILKAVFENEDYAKHSGILIVDDLGREHFTDKGFGIAEWDYFFDSRYSEMEPTIVTTNLTEEEFVEKYNRRIFDRLKECAQWLVFSGPSLRHHEEKKAVTQEAESG
jgi:hypothetical protein